MQPTTQLNGHVWETCGRATGFPTAKPKLGTSCLRLGLGQGYRRAHAIFLYWRRDPQISNCLQRHPVQSEKACTRPYSTPLHSAMIPMQCRNDSRTLGLCAPLRTPALSQYRQELRPRHETWTSLANRPSRSAPKSILPAAKIPSTSRCPDPLRCRKNGAFSCASWCLVGVHLPSSRGSLVRSLELPTPPAPTRPPTGSALLSWGRFPGLPWIARRPPARPPPPSAQSPLAPCP